MSRPHLVPEHDDGSWQVMALECPRFVPAPHGSVMCRYEVNVLITAGGLLVAPYACLGCGAEFTGPELAALKSDAEDAIQNYEPADGLARNH